MNTIWKTKERRKPADTQCRNARGRNGAEVGAKELRAHAHRKGHEPTTGSEGTQRQGAGHGDTPEMTIPHVTSVRHSGERTGPKPTFPATQCEIRGNGSVRVPRHPSHAGGETHERHKATRRACMLEPSVKRFV